jgi:hypothetical protein
VKYPELSPRWHNPLLHRTCSHCAARMWLAVIEPAEPAHDRLIFECTECGREDSVEVRIGPWLGPV